MSRILIFSALLLSSTQVLGAQISISKAYVRATPPGQTTSGAYMVLRNDGQQNRALVGASSNIAEMIEIHTNSHDNGVMRMREVDQIKLRAGQTTSLAPGGVHLMLIGIQQGIAPGQSITLNLIFDDDSVETIEVKAKRITAITDMNVDSATIQHKMSSPASN